MPGLLRLIYAYLDTLEMTEPERVRIGQYLDLVRRRASGKFFLHRCLLSIVCLTRYVTQALSSPQPHGSETLSVHILHTNLTQWSARRSTMTSWLLSTRCMYSKILFILGPIFNCLFSTHPLVNAVYGRHQSCSLLSFVTRSILMVSK